MTDFAKAQLLKYGWTEGKGLGKNESGITVALKPKLKFDSAGIGHKEDWNEWWATSFNNAANNIMVEPQSQGVTISVSKESKNELPKHLSRNKSSYGHFLKTSTLLNGTLMPEHESHVPKADQNEQDVKPVFLTDEELFKVCGGRTAHKGARHGLKLNGKLKRIEEQERNFLRTHNNKSESDPSDTDEEALPINLSPEEDVSKKGRSARKRKRRINDLTHQLDTLCSINDAVKKSKPKTKKRKKEKDSAGNHRSDGTGEEEGDKEIGDMPFPVGEKSDNWLTKIKKKKKKEDFDYESSHKKKKKNKKRKDKEYQNCNFDSGEDKTVQCQSQEHCLDRLDTTNHRKLPSNDSPLNSSNDVESFPCPDSPDTYTRNKANRLNYKLLKKKKAKHLKKHKNMVQNVIDHLSLVHVNAEDASSEKTDSKRELISIMKELVDINIAIDKTEAIKKSSQKKAEDDKRTDKSIRKKKKHCKKKEKSGRKKRKKNK